MIPMLIQLHLILFSPIRVHIDSATQRDQRFNGLTFDMLLDGYFNRFRFGFGDCEGQDGFFNNG